MLVVFPEPISRLPDGALHHAVRAAHVRAEQASAVHAVRRAQAVTLLVREVFPTAADVVADLSGWFTEDPMPILVEVRDPAGTVLWSDDGSSAPCLPSGEPDRRWRERRHAMEEHLSVALEFAEPALAGWRDLDPDSDTAQYAIPLVDSADSDVADRLIPVGWEVWVVRHVDSRGEEISLHATRAAAVGALATTVRERWPAITDQDGVPAAPHGLSDEDVITVYFARSPRWSDYSIECAWVDGDLKPVIRI